MPIHPRTRPLPVPVEVSDDRFTTGLIAEIDAVLVARGYRVATDDDIDSLARAIGGHLRRTGRSGTYPAAATSHEGDRYSANYDAA